MKGIDIGPASADELSQLAAHIEAAKVRENLQRWCVMSIRGAGSGFRSALFGYTPVGRPWLTSWLIGIDLERGRIRTTNSVYGLYGDSVDPSSDEIKRIHIVLVDNTQRGFVAIRNFA